MRYLISLAALVLGACPASGQPSIRPDADPRIVKLVESISETRLRQIVDTLASFGTRSTLSDTSSTTRGVGVARQWIFDELRRSNARLQVSFDTHTVPPRGRVTREVELRNVMAVLPGRSPRRVYVTGHYDTLNIGAEGQLGANQRPAGQTGSPGANLPQRPDYNVDAPGANDNGSGTALTMELARVFGESGIEFDATLVFIVWAGEEQGLVGSRAHAQATVAAKIPVEAAFNNDIVGNSIGGNGVIDAESVRVYSEGPEDSTSRSLARYVGRAAALYVPSHRVRLMARVDRFNRGSDHSSFNQQGLPAVVFRESNENFAKQHNAADTADGVDVKYLAQNARVNAASAASLALAPPAPTVTSDRGQILIARRPSGYDTNLVWHASAGAAGYRIYWRDTWSNDWQHSRLVGNQTEIVLPNVSIDDFVFGVAAVGADGHESAVSAYAATPARAPTPTPAPPSAPSPR